MLTKREVMITIRTVRRGIPIPLFAAEGDAFESENEDEIDEETVEDLYEDDERPEEVEMMMEGRLIETTRRVELSYDESELTGMEGATTRLVFERSAPELISLLRSGSVSTALIFEPRQRHVCVYNTPFSSFEVCVHTLKVENALLAEGRIVLDYLIEIHGARTEHCKMELNIR